SVATIEQEHLLPFKPAIEFIRVFELGEAGTSLKITVANVEVTPGTNQRPRYAICSVAIFSNRQKSLKPTGEFWHSTNNNVTRARDATCVSVLIPEFPWNIIRLVNFLDHENSDDPVDEMSLFYVAQTRVKDQQILGVQRLYLPSAATLIPIGQSSEIGIEMHPLFLKMNGKQLPPCCKRGLEVLINPLKPSTQWFRFQDWRIDEPARLCVSWRIPPTII